jgi:hypothetical protein
MYRIIVNWETAAKPAMSPHVFASWEILPSAGEANLEYLAAVRGQDSGTSLSLPAAIIRRCQPTTAGKWQQGLELSPKYQVSAIVRVNSTG